MSQTSRTLICLTLMSLLGSAVVFAQRRGGGGGGGHAFSANRGGSGYAGGGWYGGYGGYESGGSSYVGQPNYWWVSHYPSENPCQAGCNPNAGYEWDSVGTLILDTNPPKARITLDGVFAGTTDKLGPFQLPVGQHTLHIEAAGFEPTDIIVKFDQPGVQSLNIELKSLEASAKPAPRP